jgi:7,8-dihydro-6-hydroxymethylpterin-pyrophosphokinase (HPPK)
MESITVVLSLGSNYGDRRGNVECAMNWLMEILEGVSCSGIYETLPVGHAGTNYFNAVVSGCFKGSVDELNAICKEYEILHGRDEESRRFRRVPVDIDIVIAGEEVLRPRDYRCSFFRKGYEMISTPSSVF